MQHTSITASTREAVTRIFSKSEILAQIRRIGNPIPTEQPEDHVQDTVLRFCARVQRDPSILHQQPEVTAIRIAKDIRAEKFRGSTCRKHHIAAEASDLHESRERNIEEKRNWMLQDVAAAEDSTPEHISVQCEQKEIISRLLSELPQNLSWALNEHYILGRTLDKMSLDSGKSHTTVKSWLQRGRKALKMAILRSSPGLAVA